MASPELDRERELFFASLQLPEPERRAYLDRTCGDEGHCANGWRACCRPTQRRHPSLLPLRSAPPISRQKSMDIACSASSAQVVWVRSMKPSN